MQNHRVRFLHLVIVPTIICCAAMNTAAYRDQPIIHKLANWNDTFVVMRPGDDCCETNRKKVFSPMQFNSTKKQ